MKNRVSEMRQCRAIKSRQPLEIEAGAAVKQPASETFPMTSQQADTFNPREHSPTPNMTMDSAATQMFDGQSWSFTAMVMTTSDPTPHESALQLPPPTDAMPPDAEPTSTIGLALSSQETPLSKSSISRGNTISGCQEIMDNTDRDNDPIDFQTMKDIMKRLSGRHTSSYIEDVASLVMRFSFASSWRSSLASSINSFRWRRASLKEAREPSLPTSYEIFKSTLLDHRHDCLSNDL